MRWPGMRVLGEGEARELAGLVQQKAMRSLNLEETSRDEDEGRRRAATLGSWIKFQFFGPLERDADAGPQFGRAATAIGVVTIAAGLASSTIANVSDNPSPLVLGVLGILVGVLTAINQIWRPGTRSATRYQAAYALRREGWDYVNDTGRYDGKQPEEQLKLFKEEVGRLHRVVEAVDDTARTGEQQPT